MPTARGVAVVKSTVCYLEALFRLSLWKNLEDCCEMLSSAKLLWRCNIDVPLMLAGSFGIRLAHRVVPLGRSATRPGGVEAFYGQTSKNMLSANSCVQL